MSQENVEVVRRWAAAMNGEPASMEAAVAEWFEEDSDYYPAPKFPEARPAHGREEFAHWMRLFYEGFPRSHWEIRALFPVGDDRVLAWMNLRAEGRGSAVALSGDLYTCYWVRRGRFFRVEDHLTSSGALYALGLEGETLEAVGLSEQPMSHENVEIVRQIYARWARGDFRAGVELYDRHVLLVIRPEFPEAGVYSGIDAISTYMREDFLGDFANAAIVGEEFLGRGDSVVVRVNQQATGLGSGASVAMRYYQVWTFRGGSVIRIELVPGRAEALEAVGLSE